MKAKAKNEMKLVIPSNSANESFARTAVAAFMSQLDPTIEEMTDIKTAVSEAVTNCIVHAYRDTRTLQGRGNLCLPPEAVKGQVWALL